MIVVHVEERFVQKFLAEYMHYAESAIWLLNLVKIGIGPSIAFPISVCLLINIIILLPYKSNKRENFLKT